ncbi:MAG: hypothetical protein ACRDKV_09480 [Solirubrobacterales bacterium]
MSTALLAALMSGCVIIKSNTSTQLEVIGKVRITTIACASDTSASGSLNPGYSPQDPSCQQNVTGGNPNAGGNYPGDAINNTKVQLKVGYRIPSSNVVTAPSSFTSTNTSNPPATPCGGGITFNQSASFSAALEARSPAGSGMQWVGYLSTAQNYTTNGCQYFQVAPQFTLRQYLGVAPFQGPFNHRVVVGFRQVDEGTPGNTSARPVTCGSGAITSSYVDGVDGPDGGTTPDMTGICADDPNASTVATNVTLPTRDLGVVPTNTAADAGSTAQVPFELRYRGAALPSGQFNITATTNVPGATATPSVTTLVPAADSDNDITVSVPVPPNTPSGSYNVNAIATLSSNPSQTRGTLVPATLTVGEAFGLSPAPTLPSLGTITLNGQAQTKTAQMSNFGVIDSPGSSDQGWNVTVVGDNGGGKSPVFKQYCPGPGNCGPHSPGYVTSGHTLSANSLTLNSSGANWSGGTPPAPSFQCNAGGCPIDSAAPFKVASAPNGGGTGLWNATGFGASSLSLATPSTLRALPAGEQYKLDVVWTLNSGP